MVFGGNTTTVNGSSMSAGPATRAPAPSWAPSYTGVSAHAFAPVRAPGLLEGLARVAGGARLGEVIGLGREAASRHAHAAHDRLLRTEREPAVGLVLVVEALGEIEQAGLVEARCLPGPGTLMSKFWPGVGHLHEAVAGHVLASPSPVGSSSSVTSASSSSSSGGQVGDVDLRQRAHVAAGQVDLVVRRPADRGR